jgi:hypothetical protein
MTRVGSQRHRKRKSCINIMILFNFFIINSMQSARTVTRVSSTWSETDETLFFYVLYVIYANTK